MSKLHLCRLASFLISGALAVSACGGSDSKDSSSSGNRQRNAALTSGSVYERTRIRQLGTAERANFAITNEDELVVWGEDASTPPITKARIAAIGPFAAMAAVGVDGKFYTWGQGSEFFDAPPADLDLSTITSLTISYGIAHAIDDKGKLWGWGDIYEADPDSRIPAEVAAATIVESDTYNGQSNIAMDDTGKVYTWGSTREFETTPQIFQDVTAKHVMVSGSIATVVTTDGEVIQVGPWNLDPMFKGINVEMLAQNNFGAYLAVDNKGNLHTAGNGASLGTLNDAVKQFNSDYDTEGPKVVSLTAGADFFTILFDEGWVDYVAHWWSDGTNTPDYLRSARFVNPIAAGNSSSYAIGDDYKVSAFHDTTGSTPPPTTDDFIAVAAGWNHTLGLTKNGKVVSWGDGPDDNKIPSYDGIVREIGAGYNFSAVRTNYGYITDWGNFYSPSGTVVPKPNDCAYYNTMDVGFANIIALGADCDTDKPRLVVWGDNTYGQADVPSDLDVENVWEVAMGIDCAAALMYDGTITVWGECYGGIKDVPADTQFWTFDLGIGFGVGITFDDAVVVWGEGSNGELAVPTTLPPAARVVAGRSHILALDYEGGVTAWGSNLNGEIDVPESFKSVYVPDISDASTDPDWTDEGDNVDELEKASNTPIEVPEVIDDLAINEVKDGKIVSVPAPVITAPEPPTPPSEVKTATITPLPPARNPGMSVGRSVSTAQAVKILGLTKVTKVSFVVPKTVKSASATVCSITKTSVTITGSGICDVKVSYVDSKKKKRTKTLTLIAAN